MDNYVVAILVTAGLYALLAQSVALSWGMTGLVNLGLAGFWAIGAYVSALATRYGGVPVPVGVGLGLAAGALAGIIVTFSTLRLRDDYFAIVTLGFAEAMRLVAANEIWLTNGTDGISAIPGAFARVPTFRYNLIWLGIVTMAVIAVWFVLTRLARSPWGRALRAVREDQIVAAVAGKQVTRLKAEAFAISAAVAALSGALYGHFNSFIAPDLFLPLVTIYVFLAVTAGGNGRATGALVGAYLLIAFLESTRFFAHAIPGTTPLQGAALREICVGVALILILRLRPQGIFPERNQKAPAA
jgi:branched-chain amino acid transport system permease protein